MCGITGWLHSPRSEPSDAILAAMSDSIRHRGPDDTGDFRNWEAGVALAHRRLIIIDLTDASHQPMLDDERRIALAYNGELYNPCALRADWSAMHMRFAHMAMPSWCCAATMGSAVRGVASFDPTVKLSRGWRRTSFWRTVVSRLLDSAFRWAITYPRSYAGNVVHFIQRTKVIAGNRHARASLLHKGIV